MDLTSLAISNTLYAAPQAPTETSENELTTPPPLPLGPVDERLARLAMQKSHSCPPFLAPKISTKNLSTSPMSTDVLVPGQATVDSVTSPEASTEAIENQLLTTPPLLPPGPTDEKIARHESRPLGHPELCELNLFRMKHPPIKETKDRQTFSEVVEEFSKNVLSTLKKPKEEFEVDWEGYDKNGNLWTSDAKSLNELELAIEPKPPFNPDDIDEAYARDGNAAKPLRTQQKKWNIRLTDTFSMLVPFQPGLTEKSIGLAYYAGGGPVGILILIPDGNRIGKDCSIVETLVTHPLSEGVGASLIEEAVAISCREKENEKGGKLWLTALDDESGRAYAAMGFSYENIESSRAMWLDPSTSDKWKQHNGKWVLKSNSGKSYIGTYSELSHSENDTMNF